MLAGLADHHAAKAVVTVDRTEALEVGDDVAKQFFDVVLVFDDFLLTDLFLEYQMVEAVVDLRELVPVGGLDVLADDLEGVAVLD